jgi:hypothetical protein
LLALPENGIHSCVADQILQRSSMGAEANKPLRASVREQTGNICTSNSGSPPGTLDPGGAQRIARFREAIRS